MSPLFPNISTEKVALQTRAEYDGSNALRIVMESVSAFDASPVASIEEAEKRIFDQVTDELVYDPARMTGHAYPGDKEAALVIQICRAANVIACRTRRGAGNMAFAHPEAVKIIRRGSTSAYQNTDDLKIEPETIGRWTIAGKINNQITVYESDTMPEDEIIIAYVGGKHDGPGTLFEIAPNTYAFAALVNNERSLGNGSDYVHRVRIKKPLKLSVIDV